MLQMNNVTVKMFFDSARVMRAVDSATRKNLSKAGAFVRTAAKSSIRKRKRSSAPGEPPSSHTGMLKRFIYFGYESARKTVVIGPAALHMISFSASGGSPQKGTIPETLEYGGSLRVLEVFKWGKWRRADLRSRRRMAGLPTRKRKYTIAARPFMGPALKQEAPKFAGLWANSVR